MAASLPELQELVRALHSGESRAPLEALIPRAPYPQRRGSGRGHASSRCQRGLYNSEAAGRYKEEVATIAAWLYVH